MSHYYPLSQELYAYLLDQRSSASDPVLTELRAETEALGEISRMLISPDQASFLTLLTGLLQAKWALEVGTFTGMSSIAIARGLVPGGKLFCFDQEFKWTSMARRYWLKAGIHDRIDLRLGNAHAVLAYFRPTVPLDLVFIDADKEGYDDYFELLLPMMRPNGLIIFDNMLRGGQVIDPLVNGTASVHATLDLNRKLATDRRVESVMLPVADGFYLCRKRAAR